MTLMGSHCFSGHIELEMGRACRAADAASMSYRHFWPAACDELASQLVFLCPENHKSSERRFPNWKLNENRDFYGKQEACLPVWSHSGWRAMSARSCLGRACVKIKLGQLAILICCTSVIMCGPALFKWWQSSAQCLNTTYLWFHFIFLRKKGIRRANQPNRSRWN